MGDYAITLMMDESENFLKIDDGLPLTLTTMSAPRKNLQNDSKTMNRIIAKSEIAF